MRHLRVPASCLGLVLALIACRPSEAQAPVAQPLQATALATPDAGKQYSVQSAPLTLRTGANGVLTVTIKPNKGLHFNKEFPAKFTVEAHPNARSTKEKLTAKDGDVKVVGNDGIVTIPLTGVAAGQANLKVVGNFSVCSDEQCYMLRGEALSVAVTVK
jgi:hypothetical protein